MKLVFLATNYDGMLEGMVWLVAMLVALLAGVASLVLAFFHRTQRASLVCGYSSLALLVFTGAYFFFAVVPSMWGSRDGCLEATRWTLSVFIVDTALFLAARFVAYWKMPFPKAQRE